MTHSDPDSLHDSDAVRRDTDPRDGSGYPVGLGADGRDGILLGECDHPLQTPDDLLAALDSLAATVRREYRRRVRRAILRALGFWGVALTLLTLLVWVGWNLGVAPAFGWEGWTPDTAAGIVAASWAAGFLLRLAGFNRRV